MADLNDATETWQDGVYQLEPTDPVLGGAPNEATGDGMDNIPHLHLARRTRWLKARVDELLANMATAATTAVAGIVQLVDSVTSTATDRAATGNAVRMANENANSRVPQSRVVATTGLATGGGPLTANRTIAVPAASPADGIAGTRTDVAMTPASTKAAIDQAVGAVAVPDAVPPTRQVQGAGLASGGGSLAADRTITVTAASNAQAVAGTSTAVAMTPASDKAALDAALAGRSVNAGGLATGGGSLAADRTITVPIATQAESDAGTRNDVALTPARLKGTLDSRLAAAAAHSDYAIGSYVFAARVSGGSVSYGATVAGSSLRIAGLQPVNKNFMDVQGGTGFPTPGLTLVATSGAGLAGTWVCLGFAPSSDTPGLSAGPTLYRRIS